MGKYFASILLSFFLMCASRDLHASIVNNVEDPCINELVNLSISENFTNEISTLIRKFFIDNDSINLTIDQVYDLQNSLDAITSGSYNSYGVLDITISFNGNTMPAASKEYILATLYHEFAHAILFYEGVKGGQHHEPIATEYLKVLIKTLLQHFPNLTKYEAACLAWAGLQETGAWYRLMESYQEDIFNTNLAYKTGKRGSKSN